MRSDWAAAAEAGKSDLKATQRKLKHFTQSVASKPQRALSSLPRITNCREREKKTGQKEQLSSPKREKNCGYIKVQMSVMDRPKLS